MAKVSKKTARKKTTRTAPIDELRQHLRINKNALDEELEMQPVLYDRVSESAAMSRSRMDKAKNDLEVLEARLGNKVRQDAEKSDERTTERAIESTVKRNKERQAAVSQFLLLKQETEELDQLRESFRQKGYMLRELASLFISGYYQQSSTSGTKSKVREDKAERNSKRLAERRRARSKE